MDPDSLKTEGQTDSTITDVTPQEISLKSVQVSHTDPQMDSTAATDAMQRAAIEEVVLMQSDGNAPMLPSAKSYVPAMLAGLILALVILLAGTGIIYAYIEKIFIFAPANVGQYTEDTFVSSLLEKQTSISSLRYESTGAFSIVDREADAEPFIIEIPNEYELRQLYQEDAQRASDVSKILATLLSEYGDPRTQAINKIASYPATLESAVKSQRAQSPGRQSVYAAVDPVTGKPYDYRVTNGGQDFELSVTFALPTSIQGIKQGYKFTPEHTRVEGQVVTFTKRSSAFGLYLPTEPKKPWLIEMSESMRFLPPDIALSFGLKAQAEIQTDTPSDWTVNVDASGDFGDLVYKINADALKKGDSYYFRVNNMPSLFGAYGLMKGVWVVISPTSASSTMSTSSPYSRNSFSYIAADFKEWEAEVKKNRTEVTGMMRDLARIADETKLIAFKTPPVKEVYKGQETYRYDLELRKEALVPYVTKVIAYADTKDVSRSLRATFLNDQGTLDYLKSEEFERVYDYLAKNVSYAVWVNEGGYMVGLRMAWRIVPPETATQLAGKQINIAVEATLSDINKSVDVVAPKNAKPIEALYEELNANILDSRGKGTQAAQKAQLSSLRASAELAYDKGNSYGGGVFPLGPCATTPNTLFADMAVAQAIRSATQNDMAKATCASAKSGVTVDTYAVSVPLSGVEGFSWCVDSAGRSMQIRGSITKAACM